MSETERDFIEQRLGSGRLNHVFFVINFINQIEDKEEVEEIKEWVRYRLEHHFLDENEKFDEAFYNRRVFYINAKEALEAIIAEPKDTKKLEASGVIDFEKELEQFLISDEKNVAAFEAALRMLGSGLMQARQNISQAQKMLSEQIEEQKTIQERAIEALKSLETDKREIETIIFQFGEVIGQKVFSSLLLYTNDLKDTWSHDATISSLESTAV